MTTEELIEIELILTEAAAYGLAYEVKKTAETLLVEGYSVIVAYQTAFNEWVN
jgi:hypothetical protein